MEIEEVTGRIAENLEHLKRYTATPGDGCTRLPFTKEAREAAEYLKSLMTEAGLEVREDAAGNVIGVMKGEDPALPCVMMGSHYDSVVNGGDFDGIAGAVCAIEVARQLKEKGVTPKRNFVAVGFCDEEGMRFGTGYFGSGAMLGNRDVEYCKKFKDTDGVSIYDAMKSYGLDPEKITDAKWPEGSIGHFLEAHIEQGPVLENESLPAGIVSSITGFKSFKISVNGKSGHAGTLPMNMRLDAGCCACECVLAIEKVAKTTADLVATVGKMNFYPSSSNVVPERAEFTLDVRSCSQEILDNSVEKIFNEISHICENRKLNYTSELAFENVPVPCSNKITKIIEKSFIDLNLNPFYIYSGAGHDAQEMDNITDIGMVFIRCAGGVSHNPNESVSVDDLDTAVKIFLKILDNLDLK